MRISKGSVVATPYGVGIVRQENNNNTYIVEHALYNSGHVEANKGMQVNDFLLCTPEELFKLNVKADSIEMIRKIDLAMAISELRSEEFNAKH